MRRLCPNCAQLLRRIKFYDHLERPWAEIQRPREGDVCDDCGAVYDWVEAPGLTRAFNARTTTTGWRRPTAVEELRRMTR